MAIPDFALGGMENWGLVMYRESVLLYNPTINSAADRQKVCSVLAHELSHQVAYHSFYDILNIIDIISKVNFLVTLLISFGRKIVNEKTVYLIF